MSEIDLRIRSPFQRLGAAAGRTVSGRPASSHVRQERNSAMQAIARPRLLASVQQVLLPSCTPKIRPAVVQSVVVEMIDIANVSGWQVEHDPVHSYRYVLALYQSIPHGV